MKPILDEWNIENLKIHFILEWKEAEYVISSGMEEESEAVNEKTFESKDIDQQ